MGREGRSVAIESPAGGERQENIIDHMLSSTLVAVAINDAGPWHTITIHIINQSSRPSQTPPLSQPHTYTAHTHTQPTTHTYCTHTHTQPTTHILHTHTLSPFLKMKLLWRNPTGSIKYVPTYICFFSCCLICRLPNYNFVLEPNRRSKSNNLLLPPNTQKCTHTFDLLSPVNRKQSLGPPDTYLQKTNNRTN